MTNITTDGDVSHLHSSSSLTNEAGHARVGWNPFEDDLRKLGKPINNNLVDLVQPATNSDTEFGHEFDKIRKGSLSSK